VDIPLIAGTLATVVFAVSNLPMLRKALRTRDVSSYSLLSMVMINGANAVYSLYVFTLPVGPIWGLHTFYVISCAIMLALCLRQRRAVTRERRQAAARSSVEEWPLWSSSSASTIPSSSDPSAGSPRSSSPLR
jgi:uncharacterized protein with PQ loop repeat